jgi:hypothetical protein
MKYRNKNLIKYLRLNPNRSELPSITILKFLNEQNIIVYNKNEQINPEFTQLSYSFRKSNDRGFITVTISKDNLITGKINYSGKNEKLITRDLRQFLSLIEKTIKA